mmetsp:Transcript_92034/g.265575  ORF Transcript_92034/g.265575 Transcript_92034/m.265575 type:complete len:294 (-) Transcript_92034:1611-2492(-)
MSPSCRVHRETHVSLTVGIELHVSSQTAEVAADQRGQPTFDGRIKVRAKAGAQCRRGESRCAVAGCPHPLIECHKRQQHCVHKRRPILQGGTPWSCPAVRQCDLGAFVQRVAGLEHIQVIFRCTCGNQVRRAQVREVVRPAFDPSVVVPPLHPDAHGTRELVPHRGQLVVARRCNPKVRMLIAPTAIQDIAHSGSLGAKRRPLVNSFHALRVVLCHFRSVIEFLPRQVAKRPIGTDTAIARHLVPIAPVVHVRGLPEVLPKDTQTVLTGRWGQHRRRTIPENADLDQQSVPAQ